MQTRKTITQFGVHSKEHSIAEIRIANSVNLYIYLHFDYAQSQRLGDICTILVHDDK
jgi:hypothetical protein